MENVEMGRAVTSAYRAVKTFHKDLFAMTSALRKEMSEKDITLFKEQSLKSNQVIMEDAFMMFTAGRDDSAPVDRAIIAYIRLAPPAPLDQPYLLVGIGYFESPVEPIEIWNNTYSDDNLRILMKIAGSVEPVQLSAEQCQPHYMLHATSATVFAVPICELRNVDQLIERVVQPANALFKAPFVNSRKQTVRKK